jgi:hypothetical protein
MILLGRFRFLIYCEFDFKERTCITRNAMELLWMHCVKLDRSDQELNCLVWNDVFWIRSKSIWCNLLKRVVFVWMKSWYWFDCIWIDVSAYYSSGSWIICSRIYLIRYICWNRSHLLEEKYESDLLKKLIVRITVWFMWMHSISNEISFGL